MLAVSGSNSRHFLYEIGILCGYAIQSRRHPEGSQGPPGRPAYPKGSQQRWTDSRSARRPLTSLRMSPWPYCITTNYFLIEYVHVRCWNKNSFANGALAWDIQWMMTNYLSVLVWRRLSSLLTSTAKWSLGVEGPTSCSIPPTTTPGP